MGGIGTAELVIILVIVLVLFGSRKLPELSGSIAKSIREFRKVSDELDDERDDASTTPERDREE